MNCIFRKKILLQRTEEKMRIVLVFFFSVFPSEKIKILKIPLHWGTIAREKGMWSVIPLMLFLCHLFLDLSISM